LGECHLYILISSIKIIKGVIWNFVWNRRSVLEMKFELTDPNQILDNIYISK
jgi:hypothetical protein